MVMYGTITTSPDVGEEDADLLAGRIEYRGTKLKKGSADSENDSREVDIVCQGKRREESRMGSVSFMLW